MTCPTCDGEKKVDALVGTYTHDGQVYPDYRRIECPDCMGGGEVDDVEDVDEPYTPPIREWVTQFSATEGF